MDYKALGKRIREERLKLNLTQEKLAEAVDLSTAYVGQIERGDRNLTLDSLVLIANRLGVTVDYMLSDSVSPEQSASSNVVLQLLTKRSEDEKMLAANMLKLMFTHLDEKQG